MQVLSPEEMLPAVAQGAIGIECREDDTRVRDFLAPLDDAPTRLRAEAERSLLAALDGSCRTPIAALAEIDNGHMRLRAAIARPDATELMETEPDGAAGEGIGLGADSGAALRRSEDH